MDKIIARIEKDLVEKRFQQILKLPTPIRLQLKRIEDMVFDIWKLDSVYQGQIRLDCFAACAHSRLTLDQLEEIVKNEGKQYTNISFDKFLKKAVKSANKINGKVNFNSIKKLFSGTIARATA